MAKKRIHIPVKDPEVRKDLTDLIDTHVSGKAPEGREGMQAIIEAVGGRSRLAEILSGTRDKKSRAYKSQRDYISRVMRGKRGIGAGKAKALKRASAVSKYRGRKSIKVHIRANWKGYEDQSNEWHGDANATLAGADLDEFLDRLESGDDDGILDMIVGEYGDSSGFDAFITDIGSFDDFRIE